MSSTPATPSARRRSQRRDEARRAILDAAEALLVEGGFERFSMRRLAARCGYTAPTLYHHFGDKQGLLDVLVEERFRLVLERIRGVRRRRDPAETLRGILHELIRFGLDNPTHHRLLSMARAPGASEPASAQRAREALEEPLAELAARGRLAVRSTEQAASFLWVVLHGFVSLCIARPDADWPEGMPELCIETALRGLLRAVPENGCAPERGVAS
jgi:AcrR family transcriptional regulator